MASEGHRSSRVLPASSATPELVLVGANHRTAPLERREAFLRRATYARLRATAGSPPPWTDAVLLATCNRIEVYLVTASPRAAVRAVADTLDVPAASDELYVLTGRDAASHLLRVAAGLDSLAQGESQVAAQVRNAPSLRPGAFRPATLASVFERAARAAPRVRKAAGLEGEEISASHAALRFIESAVPWPHPTIALLGTGKMARIAAGSLGKRAIVLVANRDASRAREVADGLGGTGYGLEDLDTVLEAADVVLAAAATRRPLVTAARLRRVMARRSDRPLWLIDLGFPRNIDPASRELRGITLVDMDGLAPWGARPLPPAAHARAEARIQAEAEALVNALRPESADITTLRRSAETIRRREVEAALARLPDLSDTDREVVDKLASRLVNRFLHGPTERLRAFPEETRAEIVEELLRGMGGTSP